MQVLVAVFKNDITVSDSATCLRTYNGTCDMKSVRYAWMTYSLWLLVASAMLFVGQALRPISPAHFLGPKTLMVTFQLSMFVMGGFILAARIRDGNESGILLFRFRAWLQHQIWKAYCKENIELVEKEVNHLHQQRVFRYSMFEENILEGVLLDSLDSADFFYAVLISEMSSSPWILYTPLVMR